VSGLSAVLERLLAGEDLAAAEASRLLETLCLENLDPAIAGALLAALRAKGETAEEIRGFAAAMRGLARRPHVPEGGAFLDVVGTGGDASGSLNLSTGAALLAAACGVPVVKHGNRSVSSLSGSADMLEALGMRLPLEERHAGDCLEATGFTFLFAPHYHPAMKALAPVRRALGVRTVFNLLGPLTNPAAPPYLVLGAFSPAAAELLANAAARDPTVIRAFVVHGAPGWDEATPVGPFLLYDVRKGEVRREERDPAELGIERCAAEDLAGGDARHNADRLRAVFRGEETGGHADALVLGAALALEVTGQAADASEAVAEARAALRDGRATGLLERLEAYFERTAT
jgi:anthranilate phosphoribosyltransferase